MSCPHPNAPVERHVGSHVELVCRDCHARMAPVAPETPLEEFLAELDAEDEGDDAAPHIL